MSAIPDLASFVCSGCHRLTVRDHPPRAGAVPESMLCRPCTIEEADLQPHPELSSEEDGD